MPNLYEYALRWLADDTAVLYHLGRRVTKPWSLHVSVAMPGTEEEENANTAD